MTQIEPMLPPPDPVPVESVCGPDIGRCFMDAFEVYKRNVLMLALAAALFDVLSVLTLLILSGPMCAGLAKMTMQAMESPARKIDLGELFHFDRFWRLVGLFYLLVVVAIAGLLLLVLPGLFVMTVWLYPFYLVVDRDAPLSEALGASWRIVRGAGFWRHALLMILVVALSVIPELIPVIGWPVSWFIAPLAWLIVTSAYLQVTRRSGTGPAGFPVLTATT